MRVKMQYDVKLNEVPKHVNRLLRDVEHKLTNAQQLSETLAVVNEDDAIQALSTIDRIRRALQQIDLDFDNCAAIIQGYQATITAVNSVGEQMQNPPQPGNSETDELQ